METSLPTPMTARVYVNLPEGSWGKITNLGYTSFHEMKHSWLMLVISGYIPTEIKWELRPRSTKCWTQFGNHFKFVALLKGIPVVHTWM